MKMAVYWVTALCRLVRVYLVSDVPTASMIRFSLIALMMEAVQASETVVNLYQSTWCYNPEDSHLQI
jgi:hypothetical protein